LCSGFIIPASLERHGSLRAFWLNRFFRLYPRYWFSLVAALGLATIHRLTLDMAFRQAPGMAIAAKLTMLQTLFRFPHALAPYWTLTYELLFYAMVSAFFILGLARRVVFTAA